MTDGSARQRHRKPNNTDKANDPSDTSTERSRERTQQVVDEANDLLDDIDAALRKSLDLDEDASDEEFNQRAHTAVAGFQQKGGE